MNQLQIFSNPDFGEVRTLNIDGEPWFVAADVCNALDIGNPSQAISKLDDDEKVTLTTNEGHSGKLGGAQMLNVISEAGLYSLIMKSRKPEAKVFKRWITHDVIPSIRKHGAYMTPETLQAAIMNPDIMIQLCQQLKAEQDKNTALRADLSKATVQNTIMAPKADYVDELVERNTLTNFRETAKQLGVKQKAFISFLMERKFIYRDKRGKLLPYADKNDGLFEVKECFNNATQWAGTQTLVTPKGRETFRLLCQGM